MRKDAMKASLCIAAMPAPNDSGACRDAVRPRPSGAMMADSTEAAA